MYCSSDIVLSHRSSGGSLGRFCVASRNLCGIQTVEHMEQVVRDYALQPVVDEWQLEEHVGPHELEVKAELKKELLAFHLLSDILSQHDFMCFYSCLFPVLLQYHSYPFHYLFPLPYLLCEPAGLKQRPL